MTRQPPLTVTRTTLAVHVTLRPTEVRWFKILSDLPSFDSSRHSIPLSDLVTYLQPLQHQPQPQPPSTSSCVLVLARLRKWLQPLRPIIREENDAAINQCQIRETASSKRWVVMWPDSNATKYQQEPRCTAFAKIRTARRVISISATPIEASITPHRTATEREAHPRASQLI